MFPPEGNKPPICHMIAHLKTEISSVTCCSDSRVRAGGVLNTGGDIFSARCKVLKPKALTQILFTSVETCLLKI